MMNHLFLYKECGSLLILSFTSSIDKCNTALVILAIALFSRSWFPLFRILPQTASWYEIATQHENTKHDRLGHRSVNGRIVLRAPTTVIEKKCSIYMKHGKPIHRREL